MATSSWLMLLKQAEKTCIIQDGTRKVHYKFGDGREMAEEYSMDTNVVLKRAWKVVKHFGSEAQWETEVGDPDPKFCEMETIGMKEISTAPFLCKRITKNCIEWRIRNLPYPIETYNVSVNPDSCSIIVKTTNKKFYKEIQVPDLERIGLKMGQQNMEFTHKFNTLVITYKKPAELILCEKLIFEEITKVKCVKEGDIQCPQS